MMGGMGGMGGMMGGGMRSVPPTGLPFADLRPGQTRSLPTRMVSLSPPDPQGGVRFPTEGEAFRIADVGEVNASERVQKALRRLAAEKAATQVAQLVMWNVAVGLDWETIAGLSQRWIRVGGRWELTGWRPVPLQKNLWRACGRTCWDCSRLAWRTTSLIRT